MTAVLFTTPNTECARIWSSLVSQQDAIVFYVECFDPPSEWSYPAELARWLTSDRDVCVIEHDVESRPGFLAGLDACPEPWCFHAYPFSHDWDACGIGPEFAPLGHTRFRAGVGTTVKDLLESDEWLSDWRSRDALLSPALNAAGFMPHRHRGSAVHWHDYR